MWCVPQCQIRYTPYETNSIRSLTFAFDHSNPQIKFAIRMIHLLPQLSHTLSPEKKILVGVDTLASIDPDILEDSYVYVHCQFPIPTPGMLIRIWKTTVLKDCHSSGQSQLIHAENI